MYIYSLGQARCNPPPIKTSGGGGGGGVNPLSLWIRHWVWLRVMKVSHVSVAWGGGDN